METHPFPEGEKHMQGSEVSMNSEGVLGKEGAGKP